MLPRDLADGSRPSDSTHPVVVGVDGSLAAIGAARWAAAVAIKLGAPLHIVHARPSVGHNPSEAIAGSRAIAMELQHESATAILQSASHAARADCGGLWITTAQVDGAADAAMRTHSWS